MNDKNHNGPGSPAGAPLGMSLPDIYHILFRHQWKILCCSAAGLVAAACIFIIKPPLYTSAAKLYVRYVEDVKLPNVPEDGQVKMSDARGENILNSEVEILTSFDIAKDVVAAVGAEKILAKVGGGNDPDKAATVVKKNVIVEVPRQSAVLKINFQHPDPTVVQPVLTQLIGIYLKKHAEIHRDLGATDDFLTQQTTALQSQLSKTEGELRQAKAKAGVVTLDQAKAANAARTSKIQDDILSAEADLAEHQAILKGFAGLVPANNDVTNTVPTAPVDLVNRYKGILLRLDGLSRKEQELLTQFTEGSTLVTGVRQQMAETERLKKQFDEKYPDLAKLVISQPWPSGQVVRTPIDLPTETIQTQALAAKIDFLNSQLAETRAEQSRVDEMETTIVNLQRKKELEETKYRYFSSRLEQSRFDEALGVGKLSNISVAQSPSPSFRDWSKLPKQLAIIVAGGVLGGIALAFLIELSLDQTLKRPDEVETRLRLPLFLTFPDTSRNGQRAVSAGGNGHSRLTASDGLVGAENTGGDGGKELMLWDNSHSLRPFFEALRDRLVAHFEAKNLKHYPKLVAVTGCAKGAGVTTIAAGLAASLSETGEGNVLLVDMTLRQGAAHPFHRGKPACSLTELLEDQADQKKDCAQVQENLYLVTQGINGDSQTGVVHRQFAGMMPKLKTSDYDYIIFDMPPVSQISVTAKLGRFMDVNLMVVESEKTEVDVVQQASSLVSESRANVGLVLNKKRTYVPHWLHQEL